MIYFLKKAGIILFISSILFASSQKTTIKEILNNPDKYDQKIVDVEGKVINLKLKTSRKGNKYATFSLMDEEHNTLKVFIWGHKEIKEEGIKNEDKVEVVGTFQKVKYVGKYRFYNEIEAESVKKLKNKDKK